MDFADPAPPVPRKLRRRAELSARYASAREAAGLATSDPARRVAHCHLARAQSRLASHYSDCVSNRMERCAQKDKFRHQPRWSLQALPGGTLRRWREKCGLEKYADAWLTEQAARQKCERQTREIVARLATQGIALARPDSTGRVSQVGSITESARELPAVKNQVILPSVSRQRRAEICRDFEKWGEGKEHQLRYFVATSGQRCTAAELPARFDGMHRNLVEFLQRREFRPGGAWAGVECVLRADEVTIIRNGDPAQATLWPDDRHGVPLYHPHSNLVFRFPRALGGGAGGGYSQFVRAIKDAFGAHVAECHAIRNVREVVKYVTKFESDDDAARDGIWIRRQQEDGRDTLGILDLSPAELADFYQARAGMKPVQCLGDFAAFRRGLRRDRLKTDYASRGGMKCIDLVPRGPKRPRAESNPDARGEDNVLLRVSDPQALFTATPEPVLIVKNFTGSFEDLRRKYPELVQLRELVAFWQREAAELRAAMKAAAGLLQSSVHNFTETVDDFFDARVPSWEECSPTRPARAAPA